MATDSRALRLLAERLTNVERKVRDKGSTGQLAHSSIEDGALQAYNRDGDQTMVIGKQWDGTYAPTVTSGPVPPTPSAPIVTDGTEGISVRWDGSFADGSVVPMDYLRVDIHISSTDDFTPSFANRYGTIIPPTGGEVAFHLAPGTWYVKLVCWSQAGVPSISSDQSTGTANAIPANPSDGDAPASSPAPTLFSGIRELYVRWTAITNPDPVTYDVHVSTTLSFTPDSTTKVGETQATAFTIDALPGDPPAEGEPDLRELQYETPYYVAIVARDADGSATPSTQAVGFVTRATGDNLAVGSVTAQNILAGTLTGDLFSATVILAGVFKTGEDGQRVEMGPAGIQGFKSDGSLMLNFPTDPNQVALIDAEVTARSLTVTGGATFRSVSHIERDASFVLKMATGAPTATPQLANTRPSRFPDTGELSDADVTGLLGTFRLIPSEVSCIEWKEATDTWVIHQIRPNGTRAWFFDYDGNPDNFTYGVYFTDYQNWEIWSVIEITTSTAPKNGVYRMARWIPAGANNTYYLMCPQGGGFNRYSRQNGTAPPVVGSNGTDVFVAEVVSNQLNIRYFTPNGDGNNLSAPITVYQSASGFTSSRPLSTVLYDAGSFDTGGASPRYLVGERGHATANKLVYTSGTNANSIFPGGASSWTDPNKDAESFEAVPNPRCIAWMDSDNSFWTYGGDGYLHQHTEEFWNPNTTSSTVWVQEAYYNPTSGYETAPGPIKSITQERRANITVYFPPVPGTGTSVEPTAWRIYGARKATLPTNSEMWLQSSPGSGNGADVITPLETTGSHPLTSGTFPNSNPGKIESDDGALVISGDGTIQTSELTASGEVSGATMFAPGIRVGSSYAAGDDVAIVGPYYLAYMASALAAWSGAASTITAYSADGSPNSSGITLSSGLFTLPKAGRYRVISQVWWSAAAGRTGTRTLQLIQNSPSVTIVSSTVDAKASGAPALNRLDKEFRVAAGAQVFLRVSHTDSASITYTASTPDITFFQLCWVGP